MSASPWRTSSFSSGNGGQCVETGAAQGVVLVRDTKQRHMSDSERTTVPFGAQAWSTFTARLKK